MIFSKKGFVMGSFGKMILVLVCVVALVFLFSGQLKARSADFGSLLCLSNPEFDYDNDGLKARDDLCACDDNDFFESKIFYIANTRCEVRKRCNLAGHDKEFRISGCTEIANKDNENEKIEPKKTWEYYLESESKECRRENLWINAKITYKDDCGEVITDGDTKEFRFNHACAEKLLAKNPKGDFTYGCKTSTAQCKDKLKDAGC